MKYVLIMGLLIFPTLPIYALSPGEELSDPMLEQRARALSAELRCLVCQNQSIDDSDAPLARDLRQIVRQHIMAGQTDAEIKDFIVARYGEFALLKPRLAPHNYALWIFPALFFLIAVIALWRLFGSNMRE